MKSISPQHLDDSVVQHMHKEFPCLIREQTVGEALNWLRAHPPQGPIIYFYVVDAEDHLCGVVPTRGLLLEPYERPIQEILIASPFSVSSKVTVREAGQIFLKHKLMALPVVDESNHLLGIVDIRLYTNEFEPIADTKKQDDLFQLIGVHATQAKPLSSFSAFRIRFPWLGCNIAAGIVSAFLAGIFQSELSKVVALAFFIPVVLNLAESVSSQSVSLALELLRGQVPTWRSMIEKLRREGLTGLLLGIGSGVIVGGVALVWLGQPRVALCLIGGIGGGVMGAALLGLSTPYVLRLLRLEPQVAAGPIALAGADIITLVVYLNLARWLIH